MKQSELCLWFHSMWFRFHIHHIHSHIQFQVVHGLRGFYMRCPKHRIRMIDADHGNVERVTHPLHKPRNPCVSGVGFNKVGVNQQKQVK